ncbi:hypothetical protein RV14_GL000610 [Enterococcus ratti]|uniref:Uncharacterized protein n=1 Tax=Enterococcus ratti TaxID=150033 RepID=A0A1L8WGU2_9ENTE|nr:hypothetical protein RV14_GL000610 [Enterococcus ratti]
MQSFLAKKPAKNELSFSCRMIRETQKTSFDLLIKGRK